MVEGTDDSLYTRKNVLRRIRRNGDMAGGLDPSEKVFERDIDLRGINDDQLSGVILKKLF